MARFVLVNRRAGLFTDAAKQASRASVATALGAFGPRARVVSDHDPQDPLARRVVIFEADAAHIGQLRANLGPHAIIEPLVHRHLHRIRPALLRGATVFDARALGGNGNRFDVSVTGAGRPLGRAEVLLYLADAFRNITTATVHADAQGHVSVSVPRGRRIVAVEPIPYSTCWIMVADAPANGSTVDCLTIAEAGRNSNGWWHDVMGVDTTAANR